jgi:putative membrane protein
MMALVGFVVLGACWTLVAVGMDPASFAGHMLSHMGIVVVAAPLIAIGLSDTRFDPMRCLFWLSPLAASLVELLIVWAWHAPLMRRLSEVYTGMAILEQAVFLVGGILLWSSCLYKATGRRLAGVIALLATSMHMTLLGVLLTMAPRPLYGDADVSCLGVAVSASQDQQVGGVIMLLFGAVAYLIGGIVLLADHLHQQPPARAEGT